MTAKFAENGQKKEINELKMDYCKFEKFARKAVANYVNRNTEYEWVSPDDVYVVWMCKTLQNWKALAATPLPDNMYFEITFNGDKNEMYLDAYRKEKNEVTKF